MDSVSGTRHDPRVKFETAHYAKQAARKDGGTQSVHETQGGSR